MRNPFRHFREHSFAYTARAAGAIIAGICIPGLLYLVVHHWTGSGYRIGDNVVHLGGLYYFVVVVFAGLSGFGTVCFVLGLHRLAYPGTLTYRLTHFRLPRRRR